MTFETTEDDFEDPLVTLRTSLVLAEMTAPSERVCIDLQSGLIFREPGVIKPTNWDELPQLEQRRRIEEIRKVLDHTPVEDALA